MISNIAMQSAPQNIISGEKAKNHRSRFGEWLDNHPRTKTTLKGALFGVTSAVTPVVINTLPYPINVLALESVLVGQQVIPDLCSKDKNNIAKLVGKGALGFFAGNEIAFQTMSRLYDMNAYESWTTLVKEVSFAAVTFAIVGAVTASIYGAIAHMTRAQNENGK